MHARRHTYLQSFIITDICLCPLSISLLVHLSLLSIYLSICLPVYLSIHPSIYGSIYMESAVVHVSICSIDMAGCRNQPQAQRNEPPQARSPEMQALRDYVTAADGSRYANQVRCHTERPKAMQVSTCPASHAAPSRQHQPCASMSRTRTWSSGGMT